MNDLFQLPESHDELHTARVRLDRAIAAYEKASEIEDDFGDPIPSIVTREKQDAERALIAIERRKLGERA
jgi:hypothetical protein